MENIALERPSSLRAFIGNPDSRTYPNKWYDSLSLTSLTTLRPLPLALTHVADWQRLLELVN